MNERDIYPQSRTGTRCPYCAKWFRLRQPDEAFEYAAHLIAEQAREHNECDERQLPLLLRTPPQAKGPG